MSDFFKGITFPWQEVTPDDDAIVRKAMLPDRRLSGCELSYSGHTLTMTAGVLIVSGRQFRHTAAQNWAVTGATSGYARLLLTIDTTKASTEDAFEQISASIEYATAVDGFPALRQDDINNAGTVYQTSICAVALGPGGITGITAQMIPGDDIFYPGRPVSMGNHRVTDVGAPEEDGDAVNMGYVKNNFRPSSWTPTAAEVGAAPSSLESYVNSVAINNNALQRNNSISDVLMVDLNNADSDANRSGYFNSSSANCPPNTAFGIRNVIYVNSGFVIVEARCFTVDSRSRILWNTYNANGGGWMGWESVSTSIGYTYIESGVIEYENPPMMPGVEYCTTKRYHNVPVYTRKLENIWVPAGQFVEAATGVDHNHLISYKAMMRNGNYAMAEMLPYHNYLGNLLGNVRQTANGIAIDNFDTEGFSAEIYIEYWK